LIVFQIVLTVDNSALEFVNLSVYAAHLNNYLNPGSPSCLLDKSKQGQQ
jgi:hypothetical protein